MTLSQARGSRIVSSSSSAPPSMLEDSTCSLLIPKLLPLPSAARLGLFSPPSPNISTPASWPRPAAKVKLFCRLLARLPVLTNPTRPPLMHPSKVLSMPFNVSPSSTITPPPSAFQILALSSNTRSPVPSSRHPEPQCRPINVASACRAEELSVRLCFLVKVRKASGRSVGGGRRIGRIVGVVAGLKAGGGIGER